MNVPGLVSKTYDLVWLTEAMTRLRGTISKEVLFKTTLNLLQRNNFDRVVILSAIKGKNDTYLSIIADTDQVDAHQQPQQVSPNDMRPFNRTHKKEVKVFEPLIKAAVQSEKSEIWVKPELENGCNSDVQTDGDEDNYLLTKNIKKIIVFPTNAINGSGAIYLEARRAYPLLLENHSQTLQAFVNHFSVLMENLSLSIQGKPKSPDRVFKSAVDSESDNSVWGNFYSHLAQSLDKLVIPSITPSNESKFNVMVESLETWDFEIFEFDHLCEGRSLYYMSIVLFKKHDLINHFNIDEDKLKNFMMLIDDGYRQNPYHNSLHAADVAQTIHYYLTTGGLSTLLTEADIMSMLVAAIIHDYKHPGLTNKFLIDTTDPISIIYNDVSVLENFHLSESFAYLLNDETNILRNLPQLQKQEIRRSIIQTVLSTDLANHVSILAQFNEKTAQGGGVVQDKQLILKVFIKSADISHPVKPHSLHKEWSSRLIEEFYLQGEKESEQGLPISTFMDRNNPAVSTCQLGFIHFFVEPLFRAVFSILTPNAQQTMGKFLNDNIKFWKEEQRREDQLLNNNVDNNKH
eukprot:TRINITY_DN7468_c0_g1_i1.p1 TRINITY_DN7468_c0_g1~~TRINITY_DN7468_c0_g1_i1.p1  ORF type:complete len:574 (-),score=106.58 TRINITY_DN7468_c0_g1_i1:177-1898(-)